jgi:hypothetical protein
LDLGTWVNRGSSRIKAHTAILVDEIDKDAETLNRNHGCDCNVVLFRLGRHFEKIGYNFGGLQGELKHFRVEQAIRELMERLLIRR